MEAEGDEPTFGRLLMLLLELRVEAAADLEAGQGCSPSEPDDAADEMESSDPAILGGMLRVIYTRRLF